ncbi:MAG: glycosyltransferase family 1 protein [Roseburia sp.]|nr:glycosyltransferase family 1 protein [Roseburia sp.]
MKRIVMVVGGVETLEYFSYQMGKTFAKQGYLVFYYDLKDEKNSAKRLRKFIRTGETALVTFNFEGLEKEPGVYKDGLGYVWDEYRIPCYNIAVDHPYYYHDRLVDLPKEYYHISIDKCQEAYFKEFYPEYHHLGFLPLAGTELMEQEGDIKYEMMQRNDTDMKHTSKSGRYMDVVMTGNYTPPSFCEKHIHWINEEYAAFYQGIIDDLLANPHQTVEAAELAACEREMGPTPYDEIRIAMHRMIFIDLYVRNYWRGEAVKALVDAGIVVDVFGKGWDELVCERPENLRIHPQTTSLACLQHLQHAKVSLNVMPWFKDGAHDRVFNSILNGAVCVSDKSKYLCEELAEGEGVCYYDLEELEQLPCIVQEILQNEKGMQDIVSNGIEKVRMHHTWDARAKQIISWIENKI